MKRIITTVLLLCSMLCIIPSCKKDSAPQEPAMPDVEGKLWFILDEDTYFGYRFTGKTAEVLRYMKNEMQAEICSSVYKVSLQPGDVVIAMKRECKIVPETETSGVIMIKDKGEWQTAEYAELTDDSFKLQASGEEILFSTPEKLGLEIKNIVDVPEPEEVSVTGISLDQEELVVLCGSTALLKATVEPEDASDKSITWSSSNEAVATVKNGLVTTLSAGVANITAKTTDGGKTASCIITVTPEIEKVQARVKGRQYVSHFCQIKNNVEQEFEFVTTPSEKIGEYMEVSVEDPTKWEVKSRSATGFTISQNDEEGYADEINFYYYGQNKGYFTLQSLKKQSQASEFFKSWTLQIYKALIWYIEDGVAYLILRDLDKTSGEYVLTKVYEGFLDFVKSEDSCDYYTISQMFDRKTREEVYSLSADNDLQNIELNINYKSGTDAPYVTCWGISCGTYPSDHVDRIPASKIIEYLNTYCD